MRGGGHRYKDNYQYPQNIQNNVKHLPFPHSDGQSDWNSNPIILRLKHFSVRDCKIPGGPQVLWILSETEVFTLTSSWYMLYCYCFSDNLSLRFNCVFLITSSHTFTAFSSILEKEFAEYMRLHQESPAPELVSNTVVQPAVFTIK